MRIAIATLGCKANQYDSEVIRKSFEEKHCSVVPFPEKAQLYIVNTCTVTGKTDYQSRQLIRKIHRLNPSAKIVVTGCYAQVAPEELKNIPGVSLVLGNVDKERIVDLAFDLPFNNGYKTTLLSQETPSLREQSMRRFSSRTRFFLKIQDGCDSRCSYCIVPYARGKSRSMPPGEALNLLSEIGAAGYKEVVLTGIHLGSYGLDLSPSTTLLEFLQDVEKTKPLHRLRLSSIEPNEIDAPFMRFFGSSDTVCPHVHLPLQSGADRILARMNRTYSAEHFRELVLCLIEAKPDLAIGVDVIVGFPGEDEEQFQETFRLLDALPVAYLHVFPFSPRKGTPAASFPGRAPGNIIRERARLLRLLSTEKRTRFYTRFLHQTLPVLIESKRDRTNGLLKGFSRNYIPVLVEGPDELMNREVLVTIAAVTGSKARGTVQDS